VATALASDRLVAIARAFSALSLAYRASAARLCALKPGVASTPTTAIVYQSCVPYIEQGANALDAAAQRMAQTAGIELPVLPMPPVPAEELGGCDPKAAFEQEARALYAGIQRATDLAAEVGDQNLTGDTHPYGDVIYGICLPYLLKAADEMGA
jgi:hypothetical protein